MGKVFDYIMAKDWEEFQRVQLYKKIGNSLLIKEKQIVDENQLVEI